MATRYWDCGDPPGPFTDEEMAAEITRADDLRFGLRGQSFTATRTDLKRTGEGEVLLVERTHTIAAAPSCQHPAAREWSVTYQKRLAGPEATMSEACEGVWQVQQQLEDIRDYFGVE